MKIKTTVLYWMAAIALTTTCWSADSVSTTNTPVAVLDRMLSSQLSGDYDTFISCISPDGFAKLGIKQDRSLFATNAVLARAVIKKYETRLVESTVDRAVVELVSYGIRDDKGMREVRTFEVLRIDGLWLVNTDIDMSKKPYPVDKIREMESQQTPAGDVLKAAPEE